MRPKRYLSLWYGERKPCTYLTSTLTPSPNGLKVIPHDPHHLGVPLGESKTISEPTVRLAQNLCTYLTSTLTPSPNGLNVIPHGPHHLGVPLDCAKRTIGSDIVLDAPDATPR